MLDDLDRRILRNLQADPDLASADLAARAGTSGAVVWRRVQRMKDAGVIRATRAEVDWRALGYSVEVSLRITLEKSTANAFDEAMAEARKIPEVLEIQTFLGRVDLRLKVIARDMSHYQDVWRTRILRLPHVADIEALMHVATIKTATDLPI
jgi:Lrp/AsnC family transcriptional regulator